MMMTMMMIMLTPFKVIQEHRFWYQSKAHAWLPISEKNTNTS